MEVVIKGCDCKSAFQDEEYGEGRRVFNIGADKLNPRITCTVCGKAAKSSAMQVMEEKVKKNKKKK